MLHGKSFIMAQSRLGSSILAYNPGFSPKKPETISMLTFAVLLLAALTTLHVANAAEPVVLFKQPSLESIAGKLYVHARTPDGMFCLISWQKNPATANGLFVPVGWNVGEKTGLEIADKLPERQAGMVNRRGATAAQVCGTAVGAYLNSDDLSGGGRDAAGNPLPGSGGYKMMVTPEIRFPMKPGIKPFADPMCRMLASFDLQIPVALDQQKAGSHSYVNPCFVFIDPKTKVKFSYIIGTFSNGYHIAKESVGYPTSRRTVGCFTVS